MKIKLHYFFNDWWNYALVILFRLRDHWSNIVSKRINLWEFWNTRQYLRRLTLRKMFRIFLLCLLSFKWYLSIDINRLSLTSFFVSWKVVLIPRFMAKLTNYCQVWALISLVLLSYSFWVSIGLLVQNQILMSLNSLWVIYFKDLWNIFCLLVHS